MKDDNVIAFPSNGHRNPNVELLLQPDAYALIQFVGGRVISSYETDNILQLIGALDLLKTELLEAFTSGQNR